MLSQASGPPRRRSQVAKAGVCKTPTSGSIPLAASLPASVAVASSHCSRCAPFPPHAGQATPAPACERFPELHVYLGPGCNRECSFCTVHGRPGGALAVPGELALAAVIRWLQPEGNLKLYGGEPTLIADLICDFLRQLRASGFRGRVTLFSNGVQAERLIWLLDADAEVEAVLNYSILHGRDAPPLPAAAWQTLARHAAGNPGRIFTGHADLVPVGRGACLPPSGRADFERSCPRCAPVLTNAGECYACPFAVEDAPLHHHLGGPDATAAEVRRAHAAFLRWVDGTLEPRARTLGAHPCHACTAGWVDFPDSSAPERVPGSGNVSE
jgi:hypothetical protein